MRIGVISCVLLSILLIKGNKYFWRNFFLFIIFPVYPVLIYLFSSLIWKIPKFLIKSNRHYSFYIYAQTLTNFILNFRIFSFKLILFISASIIMLNFKNYLLIIPIVSFSILLFLHLIKRFKDVFEPVYFYSLKFKNVDLKNPFTYNLLENKVNIKYNDSNLTSRQLKIKKIENILLLRQIVLLFDKNITSILETKAYYKEIIFKAIYSMIFAMFTLGSINYCFYKLNNTSFNINDSDATFFNFFYYSFFTVIPDSSNITPAIHLTKAIRMIGVFIGIYINIVILILLITVKSVKYFESLQMISKISAKYSKEIDAYFVKKYKKNPIETMNWLITINEKVNPLLSEINGLFKN